MRLRTIQALYVTNHAAANISEIINFYPNDETL